VTAVIKISSFLKTFAVVGSGILLVDVMSLPVTVHSI